ncbi:DUF4124 domain-containing protein [Fontimonas sp. SYSU GA230001]|uniref:DUF4124 domain-containing protein n=1 Tax=Fontimonas sp. SYSU GA230001 TaxID=3142450 RepID=UPI0032B5366D
MIPRRRSRRMCLDGLLGSVWLAAALLNVQAARAEVYRCEQNGSIRFTDRPCSPQAQAVDLPDPVVLPAGPKADLLGEAEARQRSARSARDKADADWLQEHERRKADEERLRAARNAGEVAPGMSADEVRRLHGEPAVVSHSRGKDGDRETWSYVLSDGRRLHVTFIGGQVSAVRTRKESR